MTNLDRKINIGNKNVIYIFWGWGYECIGQREILAVKFMFLEWYKFLLWGIHIKITQKKEGKKKKKL